MVVWCPHRRGTTLQQPNNIAVVSCEICWELKREVADNNDLWGSESERETVGENERRERKERESERESVCESESKGEEEVLFSISHTCFWEALAAFISLRHHWLSRMPVLSTTMNSSDCSIIATRSWEKKIKIKFNCVFISTWNKKLQILSVWYLIAAVSLRCLRISSTHLSARCAHALQSHCHCSSWNCRGTTQSECVSEWASEWR